MTAWFVFEIKFKNFFGESKKTKITVALNKFEIVESLKKDLNN